MIYACVSNGQIVNVIMADPEFVADYEHTYEFVVPTSEGVTIGWHYNPVTKQFTNPFPPSE